MYVQAFPLRECVPILVPIYYCNVYINNILVFKPAEKTIKTNTEWFPLKYYYKPLGFTKTKIPFFMYTVKKTVNLQ